MSGYLSRLVMRSQPLRTAPTLRPFVRSKSPIAEQDQRLGVDGFDTAGASLPDRGDWALGESEPGASDILSDGARENPVTVSTASSDAAATVQRKIAGPSISTITPPSAPLSTTRIPKVDSVPGKAQARPSIPTPAEQIIQDNCPQSPLPTPEQVEPPGRPLNSRESESAATDSVVRQRQWKEAAPLETDTPVVSNALQSVVSVDPISADPISIKPGPVELPSVVRDMPEQAGALPAMVPNSKRSDLEPSNHQSVEPVIPNNIYSHISRPDRLVPRLEPLVPREDAMEFEATVSAPPSPAVVIGRINVEVVPQSPSVTTASASRSGPLTAASVSVIGPLRTGVRPNLRFSLRQR